MLILREKTLELQEVQGQVRGFVDSLSNPLSTLLLAPAAQVTALHSDPVDSVARDSLGSLVPRDPHCTGVGRRTGVMLAAGHIDLCHQGTAPLNGVARTLLPQPPAGHPLWVRLRGFFLWEAAPLPDMFSSCGSLPRHSLLLVPHCSVSCSGQSLPLLSCRPQHSLTPMPCCTHPPISPALR